MIGKNGRLAGERKGLGGEEQKKEWNIGRRRG